METAVTIAVTAVVITAGYGAFTTLIDQRARLRAAMAETERAAALRATLEDWFARSHLQGPPPNAGARGSVSAGGPGKDQFGFVTRAPTPSGGWATVMLLYIDDNPATPERGLTVRYLGSSFQNEGVSWLNFTNWQSMETQDSALRKLSKAPGTRELDSRVVGLRVEYFNREQRRWYPSWQSTNFESHGVARIVLEGSPSAPLPRLLQLPFLITRVDALGNR